MQGRATRLAIAVTLTSTDVTIFDRYSDAIWQTWGQAPPGKAALVALLGIWVASAAVIWFHVSRDLRQILCQRNQLCPVREPIAGVPGRDSDV